MSPMTTQGTKKQSEIDEGKGVPLDPTGTMSQKEYEKLGPPSREELEKILDSIPEETAAEEDVPDEPGEPNWPASPVPTYHGDTKPDA